jgi:hypothetical protein
VAASGRLLRLDEQQNVAGKVGDELMFIDCIRLSDCAQ